MARSRGPHRVAPVMGTVISIDVRDPEIPESVVDAMLARQEFHRAWEWQLADHSAVEGERCSRRLDLEAEPGAHGP